MAAYKRPATVKVREGATESVPHHKQFTIFSLYSVTIKSHRNPEIHKNKEQFLQTLSSSLNRFPLQFKREFTTGSGELKRDRRGEIEKKKERRFKGFEPAEKEGEEITDLFSDSSQEINKQNQNSRVLEDSGSNLRLKHR